MLACARIGAPHTVIFGGFSDKAIADRVKDCAVEVVITADGGYRRGKTNPLKATVDKALQDIPEVHTVVVVKRTGQDIDWQQDRDIWWHDVVEIQPESHQPEFFDAEHPLYIMYSSGTTGKPKGILHTTGGYLVGSPTRTGRSLISNLQPISTGPRPISGGLPGIPILCMDRWPMPPPRCYTRAPQTLRTGADGGKSFKNMA